MSDDDDDNDVSKRNIWHDKCYLQRSIWVFV